VVFDWMELAAWCRDNNFGRLPARESYFVNGMCNWRGEPTRKQLDWLWGIARKLERAA